MFRTPYSEKNITDELISNSKKIKEFNNAHISDPSLFDTLKYEAEQLIFYNCHFPQEMRLNDKQFIFGVNFIKCEFDQSLSLNNISYNSESENCSIVIENSTIKTSLFIQNCKQQSITLSKIEGIQNLVYSNNQCFQDLKITGVNLKNLYLSKSAMAIMEIDKVKCEHLYFQGNHYREIFIKNSEMRFSNQSILNSENFIELAVSEYRAFFTNTIITDSFITNICSDKKVYIDITDCTFNGKCAINLLTEPIGKDEEKTVQNIPIYTLKLNNNNSDQSLLIGGLEVGDKHTVVIGSTRYNQGGYRISRATIMNLLIKGDYSNTYLNLDRLKIISSWFILQYTGNEKSKFSNISTSNATLEFYESDFNKTSFSDINFTLFPKIMIWASQFRMATFDNIIWFTIDQVEFGELTKNSEQYHWECRRLYQQLKQSCEKNDDKHNALYFHSLEEKFHLKMLRKRPFKPEVIRLLLKSTNSFGDNWIKPIIFLLALSFISSVFLVIISGPRVAEIPYFVSIKNLQAIFSYQPYLFIQLINPTHSINEIIENGNGIIKPGFGTSLIDIIHKIFTTFLIFQTITAFRRQHT